MPWVTPYATSFKLKTLSMFYPFFLIRGNAHTQSPEPSASLTSSPVMDDATLHPWEYPQWVWLWEGPRGRYSSPTSSRKTVSASSKALHEGNQ